MSTTQHLAERARDHSLDGDSAAVNEHVASAQSAVGTPLDMQGIELTLPSQSGDVEILKGVDFNVADGETVAIVGPSGSGKSSLIAIAAGLEKPSKGRVSLLGQDITDFDEDALARLRRGRVSLVFQSFHLLDTMDALDNVRAPMEISGLPDAEAKARQALSAVGLDHRLDHFPKQLSGGERQRVAVARALAPSPTLVFADEPTGNLDTDAGAVIADMLFSITRDRGASLVLVTHDRELAKRADRIVEMSSGRIKA
ncbi:MAG: ABC transporter ATP-binding protein [Pseudomonadota bacterium]